MFHVSCLGICWRHDIWIFGKLKFDYLKNEKSFRSEIKKTFFRVYQVFSFRHTKRLQHRCFPMKIAKFLRTPFFTEHLQWLLLCIICSISLLVLCNLRIWWKCPRAFQITTETSMTLQLSVRSCSDMFRSTKWSNRYWINYVLLKTSTKEI